MKKYRLLFDTPYNKKGEVFEEGGILELSTGGMVAGHKRNADWFEEVVPEHWKPQLNQKYYYTSAEAEHTYQEWLDSAEDKWRWLNNNVFLTSQQAEEVARRIGKTLQEYQDELLNNE